MTRPRSSAKPRCAALQAAVGPQNLLSAGCRVSAMLPVLCSKKAAVRPAWFSAAAEVHIKATLRHLQKNNMPAVAGLLVMRFIHACPAVLLAACAAILPGVPPQHRPGGQHLPQHPAGRLEARAVHQQRGVRPAVPVPGERWRCCGCCCWCQYMPCSCCWLLCNAGIGLVAVLGVHSLTSSITLALEEAATWPLQEPLMLRDVACCRTPTLRTHSTRRQRQSSRRTSASLRATCSAASTTERRLTASSSRRVRASSSSGSSSRGWDVAAQQRRWGAAAAAAAGYASAVLYGHMLAVLLNGRTARAGAAVLFIPS